MIVSTADAAGRPSSRTVLLKHFDGEGFVFYTNYDSRKAREIDANPWVSLLFPWHPMARQVIVTGSARRTGRDETAAYFRTRPHGSQLGAWASAQSSVVGSRGELDAAYAELAARYPEGEQVPVPPHWGGFRVVPDSVEFWQGGRTGCTTGCGTWRSRTARGGWSGSAPDRVSGLPGPAQGVVQQAGPLLDHPFPAGGVVGEEVGEAQAAGHVEEALHGLADAGAGLVGAEQLHGDAVGLPADAGLQLGHPAPQLVLVGGGDPQVEGGAEEGPV